MTNSNRYPAQIFYSEDDEGFIATAPDLPGCSAFGETPEQALGELQTAIDVWRSAAKKAGNPIPNPSTPQTDPLPSGKVLLRMPRSLHARLIEQASTEQTSLNQLIIAMLSGGISVKALASEIVNHSTTRLAFTQAGMIHSNTTFHMVSVFGVAGHAGAMVSASTDPVPSHYQGVTLGAIERIRVHG